MKTVKAHQRRVIINDTGKRVDQDDIARFTANYITNGDPVAYCRKLRERIDARKAGNS